MFTWFPRCPALFNRETPCSLVTSFSHLWFSPFCSDNAGLAASQPWNLSPTCLSGTTCPTTQLTSQARGLPPTLNLPPYLLPWLLIPPPNTQVAPPLLLLPCHSSRHEHFSASLLDWSSSPVFSTPAPGLHAHCHQPWVCKERIRPCRPLLTTPQVLTVTRKTHKERLASKVPTEIINGEASCAFALSPDRVVQVEPTHLSTLHSQPPLVPEATPGRAGTPSSWFPLEPAALCLRPRAASGKLGLIHLLHTLNHVATVGKQ